jgi:putative nucleotidyltransferase with HDIG domain
METKIPLQKVIERVGDLPAMPSLVAELLHVTDDPMVELGDVSVIIQRDPALTAKLLRISNSPYYGMKQYVGTLKLALVILGVREVRNIVLGIVVADTLHDDKLITLLAKDFWNHAFFVAGLSRKLADALGASVQGEAFASGLLHDIGKLLLIRQIGASYADLFKKSGGASLALCAAEEEHLGFSHADAAAALAEAWNFPPALVDALRMHHVAPEKRLDTAKDPILASIVRVANLAAHDDLDAGPAADFAAGADDEAWALLASAPSPIPPATRFDLFQGMCADLESLPVPRW